MSYKPLTPQTLREHKGKSFVGITTVFFLHDGKGKVFFAQRSKNARDEAGAWANGAGGIKFGESILDGTHRELREEFNVESLDTKHLGYFDVFRKHDDGTPTHWLAMCFAVKVDPKQVKINEPDQVDDSGWFSLDKLPTPVHSQMEYFLSLYGDKLRQVVNGS